MHRFEVSGLNKFAISISIFKHIEPEVEIGTAN